MKKIGLIGGVTWVSTQDYYRGINEGINACLGEYNSAELIMYSVNFQELLSYFNDGNWHGVEDAISSKAIALKNAGADFFAIGSNTTSKVGKVASRRSGLALVDIFEATAKSIKHEGVKRVALLGTGFTMKDSFYSDELNAYGLEIVLPNPDEVVEIDSIIFYELTKATINVKSKVYLQNVIKRLHKEDGCEGVILGCTELPLIIKPEDVDIHSFNTTEIHVNAIVDRALDNNF